MGLCIATTKAPRTREFIVALFIIETLETTMVPSSGGLAASRVVPTYKGIQHRP